MDRNDNILIAISDDESAARITIRSGRNGFPSKAAVYSAIARAGVRSGIDEEVIDRLVREKSAVSDLLFATAKPPVEGEAAKLVWYIDLDPDQKHKIGTDGKVDFKHLKCYAPVNEGQELVSKLPPSRGRPGETVTGRPIPVDGEDVELPAGKNTVVSDDGLTLRAAVTGYAFRKEGRVHVDNVYHIKGDVDFSTGNVKFAGRVLIDGDVRSGFRVEATDSIYIGGNVEAAEVYSQNGDVIIRHGTVGKHRAKILAGGSLRCGFIQDATVRAGKDVVIERYAINSDISAGSKVVFTHPEALIRGGKVFADQGIEAVEVGSEHHIRTEVGISGSDSAESDWEKWNIKTKVDDLRARRLMQQKRLEFLTLLEQRFVNLSPEKRAEMATIATEIAQIDHQIVALERQAEAIIRDGDGLDGSKSIIIKEMLHKGVIITIGHQSYFAENSLQGVRFFKNKDDICVDKLPVTDGGVV